MSTDFRVLCLSHDPGLVVVSDLFWSETEANDNFHIEPIVRQHKNCDLVLGAYSYPLIRAACIGGRECPGPGMHRNNKWTEAEWLRIALKHGESVSCWPIDRLRRLRLELNPNDDA